MNVLPLLWKVPLVVAAGVIAVEAKEPMKAVLASFLLQSRLWLLVGQQEQHPKQQQ